jgi:flavodoxin
MFKTVLLVFALIAFFGMVAQAREASPANGNLPRILIAFFSKTGNTRSVAEQVRENVGGDMFQVHTRKPYPEDYRETTRVARIELDNNERPELGATISVEDMKNYDIIFIGYPNWWGTLPMAFFTFLEQYNLSGKTIVPFCTHEGSGLGRGPVDLAKLFPNSTILQGLAIRGSAAGRSQNDVTNWLRRLRFIR